MFVVVKICLMISVAKICVMCVIIYDSLCDVHGVMVILHERILI